MIINSTEMKGSHQTERDVTEIFYLAATPTTKLLYKGNEMSFI